MFLSRKEQSLSTTFVSVKIKNVIDLLNQANSWRYQDANLLQKDLWN